MKLISPEACRYKAQFENPTNTVIAPEAYLFTQHVKRYNPQLVVADDVILDKRDLPHLSTMKQYVHTLHDLSFCDYRTIEQLFEAQDENLKRYILNTIEPRLRAGFQRLLKEGSEFSKDAAKRVLLQIDPIDLLDWHRLVKRYGWQEEFSISLLMKVFELSLKRNRRVILVGAQINKPFLEMLVAAFQKEYGEPIKLSYEKIELAQPIAKSIVYRIRSPKYPDAWFPTTTSITKNRTQRETIKHRIETILLSLIDDPSELSNLKVGIVKPKRADIGDFF